MNKPSKGKATWADGTVARSQIPLHPPTHVQGLLCVNGGHLLKSGGRRMEYNIISADGHVDLRFMPGGALTS